MNIHNPVAVYGIPLLFLIGVGVYHVYKPLPYDVRYRSDIYQVSSEQLHFYSDITYQNEDGIRVSEQEIFNELFRMIDEAHSYVLIDMFFFSDFIGVESQVYRRLASELTQKLITKKATSPDTVIQVITDPINVMYGGHSAQHFAALQAADISVIITDLRPLRDSNPIYSAVWRTLFQWWGNTHTAGWLPNPLDAESPKLSTRTYLSMLNYKANHRKVVLTDSMRDGEYMFHTLVTSANPHDGSSAHSNSAIRIDGVLADDILRSEAAVAALSGDTLVYPAIIPTAEGGDDVALQLVTEGAIKDKVLSLLASAVAGDSIDMAMFYFADRDIMKALLAADARGVIIRLLLDPNKDAFGREKDGSPNRQVAHELLSKSIGNINIRWCNTHGEQCHSKLLIVKSGGNVSVLHGSANFTRRNLDDFNLESSIVFSGAADLSVMSEITTFFNQQWENENGIVYSVPYETYTATGIYDAWSYRVKEFTGLSRW
jgi:hypothetical protein